MKILIFSWRDIKNPKSGGAESFTHEVAKRWVKAGNSVTLVTSRSPQAKTEEKVDGVKIFRPSKLFYITPRDYLRYLKETAQFYQDNLKGKVDIVIDQIHGLPAFCKFYAKEKVVALSHEVAKKIWFYEVPFPLSLVGYLIEPLTLKLYRNVPFITVSPSTAKDLKKVGIKNISLVSEGISFKPTKYLPKKSNYPLIVSLGRITKMKRIEDSIQAFALVAKFFPKAELVIAGREEDGHLEKYSEKLRALAEELKINKRVKFLGFISEKEKITLLKQAWVLVSTSVREGWGIVIIEAAACGTPAVTYKIAGLVDSVKDGKTGLICQKNSPEELARKITKIISDKQLRLRLSKNALEYSRKFDWNKTAKKGLAILKKVAV